MNKTVLAFFRRNDIRMDQIRYIIREDNKTSICLLDGRQVMTYITMKDILSVLPEAEFLRVNKSYILPVAQIADVVGGVYTMSDGRTFVGRAKGVTAHKQVAKTVGDRKDSPFISQRSAMQALFSSYYKALKVNLTEDSYTVITDDFEEQAGSGSLSRWLGEFAEQGRVHPDDRERFLNSTDIRFLRAFFLRRDRTSPFVFSYRRLTRGEFRWAQMEILPMEEYTHSNQIVSLFVKDIQEFYQDVPYRSPSLPSDQSADAVFYVDFEADTCALYHPGGFSGDRLQSFLSALPGKWSEVSDFISKWSEPDGALSQAGIFRQAYLQERFRRKEEFTGELHLSQNGEPFFLQVKFANLSGGSNPTQMVMRFSDLSGGQHLRLQKPASRKLLIISRDRSLTEILSPDYPVSHCADFSEAAALYRSEPEGFSLILGDCTDRKQDAAEAFSSFLAEAGCRDIPVVLATSLDMQQGDHRLLELGATCLLSKPFHPEIVRMCVQNNLQLHEVSGLLAQFQHDGLTGLYERQAFFQYAGTYMLRNTDHLYRLLLSNIDDFKVVNERIGRQKGDTVLSRLAALLREQLPGCVMGGRIGGDSFAFLLQDVTREQLDGVMARLRPWERENEVTVRFGMTDADPKVSLYTSCDHANLVLESLKGQYGVQLAEFNDAFRESVLWKRQLSMEAEQALANRQFCVYYQPKMNMETGHLTGAEALVRWEHPKHGPIPASQFVPLFETSGFIAKLDAYICRRVCEDMHRWQTEGRKLIPVSVNLSRRDFGNDNLAQILCGIVDEYGLHRQLIHFELTESAYTDAPEKVAQITGALRLMGFPMELDDFGSGYSSLVTLATLDLDYLKIDKSLIDEVMTPTGEKVLATIIGLAKSLNMGIVAEGVEQEEQKRVLSVLGCDELQGYLYSFPLPAPQFAAFLAQFGGLENET